MKKELSEGPTLALLLVGCGDSGGSDKEKTDSGKKIYKIGITQQMEHSTLDSTKEGLEKYLKGKNDVKLKTTVKNAQGDNGTADTIAKQFVSGDVDLIYSVATNTSQAAVNATGGADIPVVFNVVTDGVEAGLVTSNEKPSDDVTDVNDAAPLEKQLEMIRELLPKAKKIGMIYNIREVNGKLQVEQVEKLALEYNSKIVKRGVGATAGIATTAEQLTGDVDCTYNITDNMVIPTTASIIDRADTKNIPVFAAENGQMKIGLPVSDSTSYEKFEGRAGSVAYDILTNGRKAGDTPVGTAKDTTLYINKKVAERLDIKIPDSLVERATFVER